MASPVSTTRVFNNGNNQEVRIPAEFRLNTDRVQISRTEHGDLVIHPIPAERGQALLQALQALGEVDEQENSQPMQETLRRLDQLAHQIHVMYPKGPTICN